MENQREKMYRINLAEEILVLYLKYLVTVGVHPGRIFLSLVVHDAWRENLIFWKASGRVRGQWWVLLWTGRHQSYKEIQYSMQRVTVRLNISAERFQAYYSGEVDTVLATADDGRTVKFPARVLRPFFSFQGVRGRFEIIYDEQMKFQSIHQIET